MNLSKHVKSASRKTTETLTRDLRLNLVESGWPVEAASAVTVVYTELNGFSVKITGQHKQTAETLEYGNEGIRPTAAIRKYFNDHVSLGEFYQKALENALGIKI